MTDESTTSAAGSTPWGPGTAVLQSAWQVIRVTGQLVSAELAAEGFTDLRPAHCLLLYRLSSGETQMTELAHRAGVTRQAVSLLVEQLHAGGYVERMVNPADRRARVLVLTGRGEAAAAGVNRCFQRIREQWEGAVGIDRIRDCAGTLTDMHAAIAGEPAGPPAGPAPPARPAGPAPPARPVPPAGPAAGPAGPAPIPRILTSA